MDKTGTILIVDDSSVSLMMLEGGLLPQYNVICATSGAEALGTARQRKPDLILLDIVMPKMDGFEVCRRLKQDEHLADIPVIMVTALDQAESELLGLKLGAIDFITKPYNLELVRLRVSNHLKLKFQSEELIKNRELLLDATEAANTLDGLSTEICVVDESGTITRTNQAWERFVSENNGVTELCGVGVNYLSVCSAPSLAGDKNLAELVDGIRSVLNGSLPEYIAEYQCNAPDKERWFTCRCHHFLLPG